MNAYCSLWVRTVILCNGGGDALARWRMGVQELAASAAPEASTAEQQQQQQQVLAAPPASWGSWLGTLALVAVLLAVLLLPFLSQPTHTNGHIT